MKAIVKFTISVLAITNVAIAIQLRLSCSYSGNGYGYAGNRDLEENVSLLDDRVGRLELTMPVKFYRLVPINEVYQNDDLLTEDVYNVISNTMNHCDAVLDMGNAGLTYVSFEELPVTGNNEAEIIAEVDNIRAELAVYPMDAVRIVFLPPCYIIDGDIDNCGYSSYPIEFSERCISRDITDVLCHELGHILGLTHTFSGDGEVQNTEFSALGQDGVWHSFNDGHPGELVDRSNCTRAGDILCDTDYEVNPACTQLRDINAEFFVHDLISDTLIEGRSVYVPNYNSPVIQNDPYYNNCEFVDMNFDPIPPCHMVTLIRDHGDAPMHPPFETYGYYNIMSYGDCECPNRFTEQQVDKLVTYSEIVNFPRVDTVVSNIYIIHDGDLDQNDATFSTLASAFEFISNDYYQNYTVYLTDTYIEEENDPIVLSSINGIDVMPNFKGRNINVFCVGLNGPLDTHHKSRTIRQISEESNDPISIKGEIEIKFQDISFTNFGSGRTYGSNSSTPLASTIDFRGSRLELINCAFLSNGLNSTRMTTYDVCMGAVHFNPMQEPSLLIQNCIFADNRSPAGPAVALSLSNVETAPEGSIQIIQSTFANNFFLANTPQNGVMHVETSGSTLLRNCIFSGSDPLHGIPGNQTPIFVDLGDPREMGAVIENCLFDQELWAVNGLPGLDPSNLVINHNFTPGIVNPIEQDYRLAWDSVCMDQGSSAVPLDFDLTPADIGWSPAYSVTELSGTVSDPLPVGHYLVTDHAQVPTPLAPGTVVKVATGKGLVLLPGPDHVLRLGDAEGARTAIVGRPTTEAESASYIQIQADGHPDSRLEAEGVLFNYLASNGSFHGIQFNDLFHQALNMDLSRDFVEFRNYVNVPVGGSSQARIDGRLLLENCRGRVAGFDVGSGEGGPAQVNLLFSKVDVENCCFQLTGTQGAPVQPPLTMVGLQGSGTPKLQGNLFTVTTDQTVPLTEFSLTTADLERNQYLQLRNTAIFQTHSTLYMDYEARNDLRANQSSVTINYPLVAMQGGDLDLFCGRNNFIVRGYNDPDWPIIHWTGDTHAAQSWRENFWGTGCAIYIPEQDVNDLIPTWATAVASLTHCVEITTPDNPLCPFEPLTPYELLKNGQVAEAAQDYPLARDNWRALLLFQAAAKEAGEGTLRLKALGFNLAYGPDAFEAVRDDLFAGALASQQADRYQQKILQICSAWCVEARWGDRPGAIAALNLLLANEQDKICRDTITLALLEISLYPPLGGLSAAGPGVQAGRMLARQQAAQALLDFNRGDESINHPMEESSVRPDDLRILGAQPNPFNPVTTLEILLPGDGLARLGLYNLLGQRVAEPLHQELSAGRHQVRVDGGTLASGVYLAVLEQGGQHQVHKLLLVK